MRSNVRNRERSGEDRNAEGTFRIGGASICLPADSWEISRRTDLTLVLDPKLGLSGLSNVCNPVDVRRILVKDGFDLPQKAE